MRFVGFSRPSGFGRGKPPYPPSHAGIAADRHGVRTAAVLDPLDFELDVLVAERAVTRIRWGIFMEGAPSGITEKNYY